MRDRRDSTGGADEQGGPERAQRAEASTAWVAEALANARRSWPGLIVDPDGFSAFLAERLQPVSPDGAVDHRHAADLYLTYAVLHRIPGAIAAIEAIAGPHVRSIALRLGMSESEADELYDEIRERLIVGDADRPPRIAQYRGLGPLRGWLAILAMREARKRLQANRRIASRRGQDVDSLLTEDPELAQMKAKYRDVFRLAFRTAIGTLRPRDRTLLLYQIVEGLSVEEIASVYRVHRVTVSRWLASVRLRLLQTTREELGRQLQIGELEVESLLRLIRSQMDVTLDQYLREAG